MVRSGTVGDVFIFLIYTYIFLFFGKSTRRWWQACTHIHRFIGIAGVKTKLN